MGQSSRIFRRCSYSFFFIKMEMLIVMIMMVDMLVAIGVKPKYRSVVKKLEKAKILKES